MSHHDENIKWYEKLSHVIEGKGFTFTVFAFIAVAIGSLIEIVPFFTSDVVDEIELVKPHNAKELAGRDVYQAEGCFYCHTQMIRPFKWETDRFYGSAYSDEYQYSKAGEYVFDHPFLFGSKRTGPDLAHEAAANKSDQWQKDHLINPKKVVQGSVMPAYPHLFNEKNTVDVNQLKANMKGLRMVGVPYSDADIAAADELAGVTKGDALVAYLQKLGRDLKK